MPPNETTFGVGAGGPGSPAGPLPVQTKAGRFVWLDIAKTVALVGMAIYHFGFDLETFGHLAPGTMMKPFWFAFARLIAGSFIFFAGLGLYLAHGHGIRWPAFWFRLAKIAGAAALITAATIPLLGPNFIFFGILHSIALSSLVGLMFLRAPVWVTLAAAALVLALPLWFVHGQFDQPWLIWTGLTTLPVYAVDFVPPFPWLAPFLLGLAVAKLADGRGFWARALATGRPASPMAERLAWPGRHSLAIYLIHQPVLFMLVWAATRWGLFPAF